MSTPESIPAVFRRTAGEFAQAPLVITPEHQTSFAAVDRASDGIATTLLERGIRKGDRIALYCPNCAEFLITYLGIVKAGAVVVPINLLIQQEEIAYILEDAAVSGVVYHGLLGERLQALRHTLPSAGLWIGVGGSSLDDADLDFADVVENADGASLPEPALDAECDLAAILYTSGTTGKPKGAMLTHHNLVVNTRSVLTALQLRPGADRMLVVLPMFHSFAATGGMLTPALHGVAMVPVPKFDPNLVSDVIGATAATVFLGVPSMYNLILRIDDDQLAKWRSVRFGVAGGAAMPVELMRRFEQRFGFPILEGDGPTECSPVTCVNPLSGERKPGSVGLAVDNVEIAIFDDDGHPLPANEIGEICVRGPNVMAGYWRLPEATAETFFGEWLRTGDLGYLDDDSYVFIVDRKKDLVIVNGMNVYPRMVEEVLYRHPDVLEAAVIGEPDDLHGEVVVAHLVPCEGCTLDPGELRAFCRKHLGPHQLPRRFVVRESLPKNATGKILKRELRRAGELERGVDLS
ncbi:long-chain-fatty-acid--CoA ligase [Thiosocius teredinicola]|uniref:long-chain-fatty-acid--CoA ligase n=1 Tax=Thiosocius teredinicola TaxID=1973002 RepID=UPI00099121C3